MAWVCKLKSDTPFLGREALEAQKAQGLSKRLVTLTVDEQVPLHGLEVCECVCMCGEPVREVEREASTLAWREFAHACLLLYSLHPTSVDPSQWGACGVCAPCWLLLHHGQADRHWLRVRATSSSRRAGVHFSQVCF